MADKVGLSIAINADVHLVAAGARRKGGEVKADLELRDGDEVLHLDSIETSSETARAAFAQRAIEKVSPKHDLLPNDIERKLLELGDAILADLQESPEPRRSQADELVDLVLQSGADLFHTPEGDGFARVPVNGHHENWELKRKGFRQWLSRLFYESFGKAPSSQAVQDALGVLMGRANFDGPEIPVHVRVAGDDNVIYLDLGNENWDVIKITASGWEIVSDADVKFRRTPRMLSLPIPERGGSLTNIFQYLNISEEDQPLFLAFLRQSLRPKGPYVILAATGGQGTAKSTTAKACKLLLDPSKAPLQVPPRNDRDFMISANNTRIVAIDNLSVISNWLSDTMCVLATGGGHAARELYSDADETILDVQRPVILTAIVDVVTRPDLLDRTIQLRQPTIPDEKRRPESEVWSEFEAVRPLLLGALLDDVSRGLRNLPTTKLAKLPRMADFAIWSVACCKDKAEADRFLEALEENRASAHEIALEGSLVALRLIEFMNARDDWSGTTGDLLAELDAMLPAGSPKTKGWPTSPKGLSNELKRITPNLRHRGIAIDSAGRQGKGGSRIISITRVANTETPQEREENSGNQPSVPSVPSADGENPYQHKETQSPLADGTHQPQLVSSAYRQPIVSRETASSSQIPIVADGTDGTDGTKRQSSNVLYDDCAECGAPLYDDASKVIGYCKRHRELVAADD